MYNIQIIHCVCVMFVVNGLQLVFYIFTSLAKEIMFLVALVCLFVCLWTTLLKKLRTDWDEILWRDPG